MPRFCPLLLIALTVVLHAGPAPAHDLTPEQTMRELAEYAAQGNPTAHYLLAYEYAVGDQVPQNEAKALELFHEAANLGSPGAQIVLAYYYDQGIGVERNRAEGYKWALLAVAHGSPVARQLMPDLVLTLSEQEQVEGQRLADAWMAARPEKANDAPHAHPEPEFRGHHSH